MKKQLISLFKKETALTFAIKREIKNDGTEVLTPVVKEGKWMSWTPIVKVNDTYQALDVWDNKVYTEEDCIEYINGYRDQVSKERATKIREIKYQEVI